MVGNEVKIGRRKNDELRSRGAEMKRRQAGGEDGGVPAATA